MFGGCQCDDDDDDDAYGRDDDDDNDVDDAHVLFHGLSQVQFYA